ncbi:MAG: sulfatase-like hydrolase/transferase [Nitrospirae bacterium]|nr:sulfatase-like hydrolase/transferase [Nitrospirota bacterium]
MHITPLVWLFAGLFVAAMPLSAMNILHKPPPELMDEYAQNSNIIPTGKKPNIIIVIMDALTALDMQVYGYERPTTPFITRWAEEAVVFNRVYSAAHWTTPATMSLMTGQNVWTHRLWYFAYNNPRKIRYKDNLTRILMENGYSNYAFVQNKFANPRTLGIEDSFLLRDYSSRFNNMLLGSGPATEFSKFFVRRPITREIFALHPLNIENIVKAVIQKRGTLQQEQELPAADQTTTFPPRLVYDRFLSLASSEGDRPNNKQKQLKLKEPFFALLFALPPHDPYLPSLPYKGVLGDKDKPSKLIEQGPYDPEDQPKVDIMRKRYDEFLMYCDNEFEKLIKRLEETLDMSNTIIILTSDHGESFSHNYLGHTGKHLNEQKVRIPLIIKFPGIEQGKVVDLPVSQIDIAPTVLEFAGLKAPSWMEGRSLAPIFLGTFLDSRPVFSMELMENRSFGAPITKGTIAVWDGDYKLVYYPDEEKTVLFNLRDDPEESHDIFADERMIGQRLRKLVKNNLRLANEKIKK